MSTNCSVEIENLCFQYTGQQKPVLENLSLSLPPHGLIALVGVSAIGKTTLLKIVAGLLHPALPYVSMSGEVRVFGSPPKSNFGLEKIGMLFQQVALVEHLSVLNNVLFPRTLSPEHEVSAEHRQKATFLLEELGLREYLNHKPASLSGGSQQRVALARALLCEPQMLLMDEPFRGLDVLTKTSVYETIFRERNRSNSVTIIVAHDLCDAALLCSKIIFIGRADGKPKLEILENVPTISQHKSIEDCAIEAAALVPSLLERLRSVSGLRNSRVSDTH